MKIFVEFDENEEVAGFNYAFDDVPSQSNSVEVSSIDGIFGGMRYINGEWVDTPKSINERSSIIRMKRDEVLSKEVDPVTSNTLRFNSMSAEQQQAWADYRQALLDIPQQSGFPHDVVWPTKS